LDGGAAEIEFGAFLI